MSRQINGCEVSHSDSCMRPHFALIDSRSIAIDWAIKTRSLSEDRIDAVQSICDVLLHKDSDVEQV